MGLGIFGQLTTVGPGFACEQLGSFKDNSTAGLDSTVEEVFAAVAEHFEEEWSAVENSIFADASDSIDASALAGGRKYCLKATSRGALSAFPEGSLPIFARARIRLQFS